MGPCQPGKRGEAQRRIPGAEQASCKQASIPASIPGTCRASCALLIFRAAGRRSGWGLPAEASCAVGLVLDFIALTGKAPETTGKIAGAQNRQHQRQREKLLYKSKRARLPGRGSSRRRADVSHRNRLRAGWRFLRFTPIAAARTLAGSVNRVSPSPPGGRGCTAGRHDRIALPTPRRGHFYYSRGVRICQFPPFCFLFILLTELFFYKTSCNQIKYMVLCPGFRTAPDAWPVPPPGG